MANTLTVGKYTVSQMTVLHGARLRNNQRNVDALKLEGAEAEAAQEWVLIAACTDPFIPMADYFAMPLTDSRPLVEAVEALNSEMVATEQSKKN